MGYVGCKLFAAHDHTFELIRHIVESLGQIADLIFALDGDPVGEVSFRNENGRLAELLDTSRNKPGNRNDGQSDDDADYEQSQGEEALGGEETGLLNSIWIAPTFVPESSMGTVV